MRRHLYTDCGTILTLPSRLGTGDHIAVKTGIITISDFRQKHIAAGGGAPLAVYGDYLYFSKKGEDRVMLTSGGLQTSLISRLIMMRQRCFQRMLGRGIP